MADSLQGLTIGLIGPIAPPAGGMANQTWQLRELLEQDGASVHFVAVNPAYRPAWVARVPMLRACFRLFPYLYQCLKLAAKVQLIHIMANSGWSWHLYAAPAIIAARLRGTPVIINYRGGHADSFFAKSWRMVWLSLRHANAIVVPSVFLQQVFARYQNEQQALPLTIVPNILDQQIFFPKVSGQYPDEPQSPSWPHCIVTRNLEAIYDVATSIKAFAVISKTYPTATLTIAGSGPLLAQLQQLVQDLKLSKQVHFAGRLSTPQMAQLYRSADIMLNSSLVDNSPNSIIEALACGVPVVSTNVGGISHLVKHQYDALLSEPGDHQQLSQLACKLLASAELRTQLIANGLKTSQRFYWPTVKQTLAAQYHSVLKSQEQAA